MAPACRIRSLAVLPLLAAVACNTPTGAGAVASVTLAAALSTLEVGETAQLAAVARDGAGAPLADVRVTWRVEGAAVSVESTGLVTAIALGSAEVVAAVGATEGRVTLTVGPLTPASVSVLPASVGVAVGARARLTATVRNRTGIALPAPSVSWTSVDPAIATVDADGEVTGEGPGATAVIAASGGFSDTATVTVGQGPTLTITLGPATPRQGDVVAYEASGTDAQGAPLDPGQFVWSASPASAGLIQADGTFVGYAPGPARIVVSAAGIADTLDLTITARGLSGAFTRVGQGVVAARFTSDLWAYGDYAYTGTWGNRGGNRGNRLYVWNVADPATPTLTDSVTVDAGTVNDVKVRGDGALAVLTHEGSSDGQNGITVLDLTDPGRPAALTRYTTNLTSGVHNVWIEGPYVYAVADGAAGLRIIDLTNPGSPQEIASFYAGTSFVHDVSVRDGLAFVSHWNAGLVILDVGNGVRGGTPATPVEVGRVQLAGQTHNAWYWPAAGYVFVGEEDFGAPGHVHVVDASDLANPREVATFALPRDPPHNFWVDETRGILYVGWYGNGLRAIDVSGRLLGDLRLQGREIASLQYGAAGSCPGTDATCTWAPQLHRGLVYVSDMNAGLLVFRPED
jgi:hypothetical protein